MSNDSVKIDIDIFIANLGNLDNISSFDLIKRIYYQADFDKNVVGEVLKNPKIKEKLSLGLLRESKEDFYAGFRNILKYLTPKQFITLCNYEVLSSFFTGNLKNHEYKFFVTLLDEDFNGVVDYIISNERMLKEFVRLSDNFYSLLGNLTYEQFRAMVLKLEEDINLCSGNFINSVSEDFQKRILEEKLSNETLVYLVSRFEESVVSDFFLHNPKAKYLYSEFNIKILVLRGIKFSDDIVRRKEFFDLLKAESFVDFRTVINAAETNNDLEVIERRLNNYYDEIINSFDPNTGLFREYLEVISNPNFRVNYSGTSFIMDTDVISHICECRVFGYDDSKNADNEEKLREYLRKVTSRKLSEVIVDALFEDNIYNVWLNIGEVLRYNSKLPDDQKVVDSEREKFYNLILNFDNMSGAEKIDIFRKFRNSRVGFMFYDDVRKLKDLSYDLIKEQLFSTSKDKSKDSISEELSSQYGVTVYDLRDKEYTMLIRGQYMYRDKSHLRRNCYSIIGSDNSEVYGRDNENFIYYGYNSFENDRVMHMLERDSFSGNSSSRDDVLTRYVNRIMTADELIRNSGWYSEIDLVNVKDENGQYDVKKPDFVVFFDNGESDIEICVKEAKRLGIPLVMIRSKKLDRDKRTSIPFDRTLSMYIDCHNNGFEEARREGMKR